MKHSLFMLAMFILILSSCGPGKKLKNANSQIESLNGQVATLNSQVSDLNTKSAACESQVTQLKTENIQYGKEAEDCRKAKAAIAQRMDNLNNALAERGTSMKEIREKIQLALKQFDDAGASVTYKNGLVHISMPDKLAFASGSTKMSDDGRQIISVVSDVLHDNPGVSAIIVGNTDSVAVSIAYRDNWSLSTERANAIVRVLRDTYQVDPSRLTAAGKGKYDPVADNSTTEGRAKNRRTEIILNPDLSRLWELSENP